MKLLSYLADESMDLIAIFKCLPVMYYYLYATVGERECMRVNDMILYTGCLTVFSRRAMPRRGLLNLPFVTFLVASKSSFRHTPVIQIKIIMCSLGAFGHDERSDRVRR